jgi:hypothetical protein
MTYSRAIRAAKIQDAIRQVLLRDWNPLGLDDSMPDDEYDAYIAPVYRILAGSRSEQELMVCLSRLARDDIGAPFASPELLQPIARKLLALYVGWG